MLAMYIMNVYGSNYRELRQVASTYALFSSDGLYIMSVHDKFVMQLICGNNSDCITCYKLSYKQWKKCVKRKAHNKRLAPSIIHKIFFRQHKQYE